MSDTRSQQEPSMEEILASIRRIISEDNDVEAKSESGAEPQADPASDTMVADREPVQASPGNDPDMGPDRGMDDDVLELTQMVKDDGSVIDVEDDWSAQPVSDSTPEPEPEPEPKIDMDNLDDFFAQAPEPQDRGSPDEDDLVSPPTAAAASAAFAQLQSSLGGRPLPIHMGGPTIEDVIKDLLRPLLRDWLDQNLPPMVERMVQREIEKMVRRAQGG